MLLPGDTVFLEAYRTLGTCRPVGMTLGPIPWTAVMEYSDRRGWSQDTADILWEVVQQLDIVWLDHVRKLSKLEGDAGA